MRLFALIGTIALLVLPFAFIHMNLTLGTTTATATVTDGFLYTSRKVDASINIFDSSSSDSFKTDWFNDNGMYHSYFDPSFELGIVVLILIVINIGLAIVADDKKYKSAPAVVLIICGLLLTYIRLTALNDQDLSFYKQTQNIFGDSTYLEVPLALLYSLIFGILDLRK